MAHKVAFTGAGCVGKTEILHLLKEQPDIPEAGFVGEAAMSDSYYTPPSGH